MRQILSLQGGMAAGKTTLAKRLQDALEDVLVVYENPYPLIEKRKQLNLDLKKEKDFILNQKMFIEQEVEKYRRLPDANIIYDRGPEDIEFYTLFYPISIGKEWDMEGQLKAELSELRACRSDAILYLDAKAETLLAHKQGDATRSRNSFGQAMSMLPYEKAWFAQFPTMTMLEIDKLDPQEVESRAQELLAKLWKV
ncbi:AAA family ATPase [Brevibacillus choshinensis]|uniref:AAA family ATPase n=1 Tax=Brevibacillus choshinensis TaxID=54911 RepID=UPI002E23926C|nr:AAA family ATPase [Brevibacillus choshinensis]